MANKNPIEKMLEHLIMNENEKASEMLHQIVVQKSRKINESFDREDVDRARDIQDDIDEIENEVYYSDIELSESEEEGEEEKEEDIEDKLNSHIEDDKEVKKTVFDLKADFDELRAEFERILGSEEQLDDIDDGFDEPAEVEVDGKTEEVLDEDKDPKKDAKRAAWAKKEGSDEIRNATYSHMTPSDPTGVHHDPVKEKKLRDRAKGLAESYEDPYGDTSDLERALEWCSDNWTFDNFIKTYGRDFEWADRALLDADDKVLRKNEVVEALGHYMLKEYEYETMNSGYTLEHSRLFSRLEDNIGRVAEEAFDDSVRQKFEDAGYTFEGLELSESVKEEFYVEQEDDDWLVFSNDTGKAVSSWSSKADAEADAKKRNGPINEEFQSDFEYEPVHVELKGDEQTGNGDETLPVDTKSPALSTPVNDRVGGAPVQYAKSEPEHYGYNDIEYEFDLVGNTDVSSDDFYGDYFVAAVDDVTDENALPDGVTNKPMFPLGK